MSDTEVIIDSLRIGFIGAGNLAQILIKGFLSTGLLNASQVYASDVSQTTLDKVKSFKVHTTANNQDIPLNCKVVLVAVEPHIVPVVLAEVSALITTDHLIVSVAAGVPIGNIEKSLAGPCRVVRVMTNTPTSVQNGVTVFSLGKWATKQDCQLVQKLFSTVGLSEMLPETYLDAVTGVSGSGPAYGFVAIEALSDGGVLMGLPRDISTKLAAQTLLGAAQMVLQTGRHPGELKDGVTSPGGTTIAALQALEEGGFRAALMSAVKAATVRSKELADE